MRHMLVIGMALCAASCGGESTPANNNETTNETVAAATIYDGGPAYGMFEATSVDGTVLTQTAREDGTVTSVDGDGTVTEGTFVMEPEQFCITNEGAETQCYAYSDLKDDGSWTATNVADPADVWTVKRLAAEDGAS